MQGDRLWRLLRIHSSRVRASRETLRICRHRRHTFDCFGLAARFAVWRMWREPPQSVALVRCIA